MNFIDIFNNATPAPKMEPIPAGLYNVRVVSGRSEQTKKGDDAYKIAFEIIEGPSAKRKLYRIFTLTEKAAGYAKRDLEAFKITRGEQLLEVFPPVGQEVFCRLMVAVQRNDAGDVFNDIKRIDEIKFIDSANKQFLIDPNNANEVF